MAKKIKDPFPLLTAAEKEELDKLSEDEINKKIAEIAKNNSALQEAKKNDEDLKKLREQVKIANEPYSLGSKTNGQRIAYLRMALDGKGKPSGDAGIPDPEEANQ